ncbi:hypothetical protein GCM10022403_038650 [Streptomyces coacervatus]|uniref:Uncharacterized protein n=1 Tax=Streptomyces coacervatus TaxID=647381 RepID=A0ABP7HSZ2_9ACTN|nr:daptide biosynthesis RiPP recognition protein [Streptomyces coacervatus]MDF2270726.1 hypothetical protein [Streptomyces coacervatus]
MSEIKERLMVWATGRDSRPPAAPDGNTGTGAQIGCRTVVVESADHLAPVLASDIVGPDTTVFAPEGSGDGVVGCGGSAAESGAEFSLGTDFYLQVQSYGISGYMSVIGPTLVRVADTADLEAYVADADRARQEGVFPDFLASHVTQLADLPALGAAAEGSGPALRLYVAANGALSTSPGGLPLGRAGDGLAAVEAEWNRINDHAGAPCAVSLGAVVPGAVRAAALAQRPWLGRYLVALDALRNLSGRAVTGAAVSGFGGRCAAHLAEVTHPADATGAEVPLLLWTDDAAYVHVPADGRMLRLRREAAALVETLLVCGSVDAADGYADREELRDVERAFADTGVALCAPVLAPVSAGR